MTTSTADHTNYGDYKKRKVSDACSDGRLPKHVRTASSELATESLESEPPSAGGSDAPRRTERHQPPQNDYMKIACRRESWLGEESLQTVIVFGGSYSLYQEKLTEPNDDGFEDSLAADQSTWVAHLSNNSRRTSQTRSFAVNGATTADDLSGQLARFFVEFPPKVLGADSTTYFLFLGSNDCGQTDTETEDLDSVVETLLDGAHDLYVKAGARNFVFLDVAPMDRTPIAIATASEKRMIERTATWNESLQRRVEEFAAETPRASVFLFSANAVLSAVLDDPEEYDFTFEDVEMEGGAIWEDELHPTSEVHSVLADRLLRALLRQDNINA